MKFKYIIYFQLNDLMLLFGGFAINVTINGYTVDQGHYCHPYSDMNATNLTEAKKECLGDPSCYMFYKVCNFAEQTSTFTSTEPPKTSNFPSTTSPQTSHYSGFRKCNHPVKTPYDEYSNCALYKKGNRYKLGIYIYINTSFLYFSIKLET